MTTKTQTKICIGNRVFRQVKGSPNTYRCVERPWTISLSYHEEYVAARIIHNSPHVSLAADAVDFGPDGAVQRALKNMSTLVNIRVGSMGREMRTLDARRLNYLKAAACLPRK